jgi:cupin fold WbuC family metalloprotein
MNLHKVNEEVFVADGPVGAADIAFLMEQASNNPRKRARICAHANNEDALHEMLIVMCGESYIRPHRHVGKSESYHVIVGEADFVLFDDAGAIVDVIELGALGTGRVFFYRVSNSTLYHTLVIRSDFLVVHEVTNGPFDRDQTIPAGFAPAESDVDAVSSYRATIDAALRN